MAIHFHIYFLFKFTFTFTFVFMFPSMAGYAHAGGGGGKLGISPPPPLGCVGISTIPLVRVFKRILDLSAYFEISTYILLDLSTQK